MLTCECSRCPPPSNKQIYTLHLWCAQELSTTYGRKTQRIAGIQYFKKRKKIPLANVLEALACTSFFMPFYHLFEKHCTPLVCNGNNHCQPAVFSLFLRNPTRLKSTDRQAIEWPTTDDPTVSLTLMGVKCFFQCNTTSYDYYFIRMIFSCTRWHSTWRGARISATR